jgi:hypothetical protein
MTLFISVLAVVTAIITIATKVIEFRTARLKSPTTPQATATPQRIPSPAIHTTVQRPSRAELVGSFCWIIFSVSLIMYFILGPDRPATRHDLGWIALALLQYGISYLDFKR